jgi:hypothetical protein
MSPTYSARALGTITILRLQELTDVARGDVQRVEHDRPSRVTIKGAADARALLSAGKRVFSARRLRFGVRRGLPRTATAGPGPRSAAPRRALDGREGLLRVDLALRASAPETVTHERSPVEPFLLACLAAPALSHRRGLDRQ